MTLKKSKDLTNESVKLITAFQKGEITPIKTGIPHLDDALLGGLLPSTVVGICARSGHGKTYDLERIQRYVIRHEPDVIFLNCAWEMEHFKLLIRDLSVRTGKSPKEILFQVPANSEEFQKFKEICDDHRQENIYYQNEPVDDEEFYTDVEFLIEEFPKHKILVSIDNLENILNTKGSQKESMDALLYQVNRLKKVHPYICFIILDQLNGKYLDRLDDIRKQRPLENDIYGTEQLLKLCDVLYVKVLPWKWGIRDKFLSVGRSQYDWLDEHKIEPSANSRTTSFDPFGKVFYFYLKLRQPENERKIKDLFIETIFTREDVGEAVFEPAADDDDPVFDEKPKSPEIVVTKTPKSKKAKELNDQIDDKSPF